MDARDIELPYEHRHAAHCESGVVSGLLRHHGVPISEPMAFGLGAALVFAHLPWPKVGGFPLTSYRMPPGTIVRGVARRLGIRMVMQRYRRPEEGRRALDDRLAAGQVVGAQTSVFWLPYFPPDMRFHFNAHNLVVYGRGDGFYRISDPVFEQTVTADVEAFTQARFVRGVFAPRGLLYWPEGPFPEAIPDRAIRRSIRATMHRMLHAPLPFIGVAGIRTLARRIRRLRKADPRYARLFVHQVIRMQEEIGTGGGGFRFMYASFLQEAAGQLQRSDLDEAAEMMTAAGDQWREFALLGARLGREGASADYAALAGTLEACARHEEEAFRHLRRV
ncbi:MAG: BtrH N-terminal domain-containing protein [Thiohalospira sp.]